MNNELNHECIICGMKYHHCDDCNKMKSFTPWRAICDTEIHYQIYMTIIGYRDGFITKEQAKDELNNIGITTDNIDNFKDSAKGLLKEILNDNVTDKISEE